jgi:hypothetical protein
MRHEAALHVHDGLYPCRYDGHTATGNGDWESALAHPFLTERLYSTDFPESHGDRKFKPRLTNC